AGRQCRHRKRRYAFRKDPGYRSIFRQGPHRPIHLHPACRIKGRGGKPRLSCSSTKPKLQSKPGMEVTDALHSVGKSLSPKAAPPAAMAVLVAAFTSSRISTKTRF